MPGTTISTYLIQRLRELGARHVFGVPGDYVLGFYKALEDSDLEVINTCDEQGAGFAADAYARFNGLGVVCITYCVGGLKVANTTAQAYAEKSPVVVISGAPGMNERLRNPLLHHKVRDFDTQLKVFQQLTEAATVLDNPQTAAREIDRVLNAAVQHKRPVYIELPRDMANVPIDAPAAELRPSRPSYGPDPIALREAVAEALERINAAARPVILADIEIQRFGLQGELMRLVEGSRIPVAATILSKSVVREDHPLYLGVYEGAMGRQEVTDYVEGSDCLIMLGVFMTDVNLGIFTAQLDPSRIISATSDRLSIRYHTYDGITLADFLPALIAARPDRRALAPGEAIPHPPTPPECFPVPDKPLTVRYLFERLNQFLDDSTAVLADPGDAMFAGIDMTIHCASEFSSPAYYTSLGYAVPAAIGVQLARPDLRPLVLVGDGAFQMTGMELSTVARFGLNPIVVVLNNEGYGTERPMLDGRFNDILNWRYSDVVRVLGAGRGHIAATEEELEEVLLAASAGRETFHVIEVRLAPDDRSEALHRLTSALAQRVRS
ncbi:MAG: alpha-keto acid decarboxylase family protein [Anaerolineae bacterium]|nr:alpha-keto acid decarboxylase family protein [Anaerolineae bacterium]